jgi:hypothetical protein
MPLHHVKGRNDTSHTKHPPQHTDDAIQLGIMTNPKQISSTVEFPLVSIMDLSNTKRNT